MMASMAERFPLEGMSMPRLFQHVASPADDSRSASSNWLPPVPAGDDLALGLECANPMLQIERWLADAEPIGVPPLN
jgi:hypothetical protein